MGKLSDWGNKNSKYITIKPGEILEGVYQDAKISQSTFNPGENTVSYLINGKIFNSASRKLALMMDDVPKGSYIKLQRFGEGPKTRYHMELINPPEGQEPSDIEETG